MTPTIYILVVEAPPTQKDGCKACQFEDDYRCTVRNGMHIGFDAHVPDWCPLQRVVLEAKE